MKSHLHYKDKWPMMDMYVHVLYIMSFMDNNNDEDDDGNNSNNLEMLITV